MKKKDIEEELQNASLENEETLLAQTGIASEAKRSVKRGWFAGSFKLGKWTIRYTDLLFCAVFCAAAVFFIRTVPYGITVADESLYQFYVYRLCGGDLLLRDEWTMTNLIAFFTYVPYRLYVAFFGGTEGLVLALRYLYIGIKLIFFLYIYLRLRKYGLWAIFAGAFYIGTDLFGMKTTSYYSVCLNAAFLAGMILFREKPNSFLRLTAAGFLFSCAVVAEPPAALLWFCYSALVLFYWICGKKGKTVLKDYDFVLNVRVWRGVFCGICCALVVFAALCAFVFTGTDLRLILEGLYRSLGSFLGVMSSDGVRWAKLQQYFAFYHPVFAVLFLLLLLCAFVLRRRAKRFHCVLFALLSVLYVLMSLRLILIPFLPEESALAHLLLHPYIFLVDASGECVCHPVLLCLLAMAAYLFTEKKDKRLFAFLFFTFGLSLVMDLFSNNSFGSMLLAGGVPAVLLLRNYFLEQRAALQDPAGEASDRLAREKDKNQKKRAPFFRRGYKVFLCVILGFTVLFEGCHYCYMGRLHETERGFLRSAAPLDTTLEDGILKGVITTREVADNYRAAVADAGQIRRICKNRLVVADYDTTMYFHTGAAVGSPAVHITVDDWSMEEAWWRAYPEKRPDVAYIPFFSLSYIWFEDSTPEEKLAYFESVADVSVTKGEIGYIVKIENWHLADDVG